MSLVHVSCLCKLRDSASVHEIVVGRFVILLFIFHASLIAKFCCCVFFTQVSLVLLLMDNLTTLVYMLCQYDICNDIHVVILHLSHEKNRFMKD